MSRPSARTRSDDGERVDRERAASGEAEHDAVVTRSRVAERAATSLVRPGARSTARSARGSNAITRGRSPYVVGRLDAGAPTSAHDVRVGDDHTRRDHEPGAGLDAAAGLADDLHGGGDRRVG